MILILKLLGMFEKNNTRMILILKLLGMFEKK